MNREEIIKKMKSEQTTINNTPRTPSKGEVLNLVLEEPKTREKDGQYGKYTVYVMHNKKGNFVEAVDITARQYAVISQEFEKAGYPETLQWMRTF